MAQMDALVWQGPRDLTLQSVPLPTLMAGDVLVAVEAVGICGSELSGYLGQNSLRTPPLIMGHEAAGHIAQRSPAPLADGSVAAVGTRVTFNPLIICGSCDRCQQGMTTLCRRRQLIGAHRPGAFASFVAVPAAQCWPLPASLSAVAAALTEPLACAVRAVSLAQLHPTDRLLILGAGPIGLFCLAVARAQGVTATIVSDMAPSRLATAHTWGAEVTINAHDRDVLTQVMGYAPGGVDAVIDAVGASGTRSQALQAVVPGGVVVFIGLHDEDSFLACNYLVRQEITLRGCFAYRTEDFAHAFALLTAGEVSPNPDWLEERPLAEGDAAFAELVAGTAWATKVMLRVR